MEGIYDIYCGEKVVGSAKVRREGLYYRFDCECQAERKEICKLYATCAQKQILLGTPIPEGQVFRLRTKLPVKLFSGVTPEFRLLRKLEETLEIFVPVRENEPFLHLKDLKNAVMQVRGGECGIVIKKQPDA